MAQSTHDVRRANRLNIVNQSQNSPSGMSVKQCTDSGTTIEKAPDGSPTYE